MSEKKDNEKTDTINYAVRWRPDWRYSSDKFITVELNNFKSSEPSVTDKEAYRVTLASLRGELAQGSGNPKVGSYSLKEGQEYDPKTDFSFLNRKDLTIVELDEYIKVMKENLNDFDGKLNTEIEEQLAKAQHKREQLEKDSSDKNSEVKE